MQAPLKSQLSPQRRKLVELFQGLGFGSIENLPIAEGEPYFDRPLALLKDIKLGAIENRFRADTAQADFRLKAQLVELFALLDELQDGVIPLIVVQNGLPFRVVVRQQASV